MKDLVIVGAGGFGRETVDTVRAINDASPTWNLVGVVDDHPSTVNVERMEHLDVPFIGTLEVLPTRVDIAVAIGSPPARQRLVESLRRDGHAFPSLLHPSTVAGSQFTHGEGLVTLASVSIGTNVSLGDHVHLNAHAVIGHDAHLADYVSINPNAAISGDCLIGASTLVGAGSVVLQQLSVGPEATVGAAACVTSDVPPGAIVVGVPARPI